MKISRSYQAIFALFLSGLFLLAGCGGGGSDKAVLEISGNDAMQFDKKELRVKEGQAVTLTLKHTGTMSLDVMGHNFVLLKADADIQDFGMKAATAKDTDYIPASETDKILAKTKMIGGGESVTITFQAPAKGSYPFLCTFPGHFGMMQGKLIVE